MKDSAIRTFYWMIAACGLAQSVLLMPSFGQSVAEDSTGSFFESADLEGFDSFATEDQLVDVCDLISCQE